MTATTITAIASSLATAILGGLRLYELVTHPASSGTADLGAGAGVGTGAGPSSGNDVAGHKLS